MLETLRGLGNEGEVGCVWAGEALPIHLAAEYEGSFCLVLLERDLRVNLAAGHGFAALVVGTFLFYLSVGEIEAEKEQRELRSAGKLSPGVSWNERLSPENVEVELSSSTAFMGLEVLLWSCVGNVFNQQVYICLQEVVRSFLRDARSSTSACLSPFYPVFLSVPSYVHQALF